MSSLVDMPDAPGSGLSPGSQLPWRQAHVPPDSLRHDGTAAFDDLPAGGMTVSVSASGFVSGTRTETLGGGAQETYWQLEAEDAWTVGVPVILGTRMLERATDGSSMAFSVDVAVIDGNSEALQTLTSANFSLAFYDCGWDPRDCASDSDGNFTGGFHADGEAEADGGGVSVARRTVLVMTEQRLAPTGIEAVTAFAEASGVHLSLVYQWWSSGYGFSEASLRTGGFAVNFEDPRQLAMAFGAMGGLLAGSVPYYRIQFRLEGDEGTFVSQGNAKIRLLTDVPTAIPSRGVFATLDVAIP